MEYPFLVLLHLFFAVLWAGGAIAAGFFFVPSVVEAGPAGAAVMGGVMKRGFANVMTISGGLVVLSGIRLYMLRFSVAWLTTANGIVLTVGALLGLGAFAIGLFVQKPAAQRIAALGAQIAASGAPPSAEQAAELGALRARLGKIARVTAFHLIAALVLMAAQRLAAAL